VSEQYTISAVSEHTVDDGDYRIYYVRLNEAQPKEGVPGFEIVQKRASKAPKAGQTILVKTFQEGTRDGKPTVKIVKDWDAIKASQASGGGQSPQGSDERGESIERQVAAKVAGLMVASHPVPQTGPVGVIANFEEFFDTVLKKIQGGSEASRNGGGEVPADMTGLPTSAPVSDDSQITF
jgi:hypothetical protein